jgi:hypothetical protein
VNTQRISITGNVQRNEWRPNYLGQHKWRACFDRLEGTPGALRALDRGYINLFPESFADPGQQLALVVGARYRIVGRLHVYTGRSMHISNELKNVVVTML